MNQHASSWPRVRCVIKNMQLPQHQIKPGYIPANGAHIIIYEAYPVLLQGTSPAQQNPPAPPQQYGVEVSQSNRTGNRTLVVCASLHVICLCALFSCNDYTYSIIASVALNQSYTYYLILTIHGKRDMITFVTPVTILSCQYFHLNWNVINVPSNSFNYPYHYMLKAFSL